MESPRPHEAPLSRPIQPITLVDPGAPERGHGRRDHSVQFYEDDAFLASLVANTVARNLAAGRPAMIIVTPGHRRSIVRCLAEHGIDVPRARREGRLTLLDARTTLRSITRGALPDGRRFREVIGGRLDEIRRGNEATPVCLYGEMVDLLLADRNVDAALCLEALWNELSEHHEFALLCAYRMDRFPSSGDSTAFRAICAAHTHVSPTERYLEGDEDARLTEVSALQQRARALESEIGARGALERRLSDSLDELALRDRDLRDVLENAAEGIHLVGPDGTIQWANRAELELLGYEAHEYIGHNIAEFHADQSGLSALLERLAGGEEVHAHAATLCHKDGSVRHVLVNSNVRFENGVFRNTRCFTRDITALHEASLAREAALERERIAREAAELAREEALTARRLAEHANRAKSDFLTVMSHELRTPLNAISGYAELLALGIHGPMNQLQRESVERIQRSQRVLLGLVNQVLNYARIESGSVQYALEDARLDDLVRAIEGFVAPQMQAKGLDYRYESASHDVTVRVDVEKLQQVLLNLLTNATKFTNVGGSVRLVAERCDDGVALHVIDSGIGIPAAKTEAIFEPFVQVDVNYTRTRDGVGLGLAISRDLARGMGGDLVLTRSVEGEGTTFTLVLPVLEAVSA
jgi:PAS domain S-box-containing protein